MKILSTATLTALLMIGSANAELITTGSFSGGDQGEGLDLQGNFSYAINIMGAGGFDIGDASFTSDTNTYGFSINAEFEYDNWRDKNEYGNSTNDNNLETVMHSIRWSRATEEFDNDILTMNLENLIVGNEYSLQLLFAEKCCNRGFDVFANNKLIADDFAPYFIQGTNPYTSETHNLLPEDIKYDTGAFLRYSFIANTESLNITMGGESINNSDNNPLIQGLTLENNSQLKSISVDEPNSLLLLIPLSLLALRRKVKS
tara:strand:- start:1176 stop:1952 length:777 start_codon:yes stop_codon:yes gene_type:complete